VLYKFAGDKMTNDNLGVPVKLLKNYALVKETLERIGVRNSQERKFFPSCYCVEENGEYRIYHFKELFVKEGRHSDYNDLDELRRNTIIHFMKKWGLIECDEDIQEILAQKIDVLNHRDKPDYKICHKYYFKKKVD
jgi:hypothetical protein